MRVAYHASREVRTDLMRFANLTLSPLGATVLPV